MNPESGRRFGPYEIQSRLGGGGMGHVFRAWDARLHREVAIKLLNHEYAMPGMRERFLREARAASALNHPNICTIFDIGEQDGDPYLVMELLQGQTLKDRILNRTMQLDEIIAISRETAEALGAAHSKGVVHRDVKPANIFLVDKPNGAIQAKVLDFGLAKIEGGALGARGRSLDLTTVGATVGTLAYMSPEQARGESLDSRSDLFSLGVVMYEMATRHVPFQGATSALVFVQLLNHAPEPVREWNEAVPRELEKIIFKLLAKERTARFQTAREVELALIALNEKGSGGWLRKAVSTVPLVRAQDPVARGKRPSRHKVSSDPGLQPPARPVTPIPPGASRQFDESARTAPSSDQVLRPVARVPRSDATPQPARNTPAPANEGTGWSSPAPDSTPSSGNLSPSQRILRARASFTPVEPDRLPSPEPSTANPSNTPKPSSGDRMRDLVSESRLPVRGAESSADLFESPKSSRSAQNPIDPPAFEENFPPLLDPAEPHRRSKLPFHPVWLGISGMVAILAACILFVILNRSRFSGAVLNRSDAIVLAEIENRTGDKSLDHSVTEALRIELAQSPYFAMRSGDSYRAAHRLIAPDAPPEGSVLLARKTAERLGAKAYLYGSITGGSSPYTLHVDLRSVSSNDVIASAEAQIDSLQQVPRAIDQVAGDIRVAAGEPRSSVDASSIPIETEASPNLLAVQHFYDAQSLLSAREPVDAIADLQQAVSLDPKFVQANLLLANVYRQLRAETAAANAANLAVAAAGSAGERTRTLAQAEYEIETTGDFPRATTLLRHLVSAYPNDAEALTQLAYTLQRQGHMAEALQIAQEAYNEDPFDLAAYTQAQAALIGLDRYDAAYELDLQAKRLGLARPGGSLIAADLGGHADSVNDLVSNLPVGKIEYRPDWAFGIYLDNAGRLAAGSALWRSRAEAAQQNDSLKSAAVYLLAQGALDRALLGDCTDALAMLHSADSPEPLPAGRIALFRTGMASALCGESAHASQIVAQLRKTYPQSFEVNGFFVADIQAALDLHTQQPGAALAALSSARSFDLISITPFLRGQAHVANHEIAIGIVDFQTELAHRGTIYLVGDDVYPAAQIGVARAFAASGDLGNSAEAYRKFLSLWRNADPTNPLVIEAATHSRP
jgi:serine/threonine protein kinase/tetratricopeptide (TPR) repeat protein